MATPQTPQPARDRRSTRYAPFIAVVVVVAIVVVVIAVVSERQRRQEATTSVARHGRQRLGDAGLRRRPDLLQRGQGEGNARQVHVAAHCDTTTGRVAIPILEPAAVRRRVHRRQRRRDVAGRDRRHDQDRLLHRQARPDVRRAAEGGGRVRPARDRSRRRTRTTCRSTQNLYETLRAARSSSSGSTAPGSSTDEVAAKADADKAAADGVFAVMGGPAQARELRRPSSRPSTSSASGRASSPRRRRSRGARAVHVADRPVARADGDDGRPSSSRSSSSASPRVRGRRRCNGQAAHVRAAELRHPRRPVQGVVGRLRTSELKDAGVTRRRHTSATSSNLTTLADRRAHDRDAS